MIKNISLLFFVLSLILPSVSASTVQSGQIAGVIIIFTLIALLLIFFVLYTCCYCNHWIFCPLSTYQQMKRIQRQVTSQNMRVQDFISMRNQIVLLINETKHEKLNFQNFQNSTAYSAQANAQIINQASSFISEIKLKGNDDCYGDWWAKGYILNSKNGMCLWFCKVYKQTTKYGRWDHLIYQSHDINLQREQIKGIWYSKRYQYDESRKGTWAIRKDNQQLGTKVSEEKNVTNWQNYRMQTEHDIKVNHI